MPDCIKALNSSQLRLLIALTLDADGLECDLNHIDVSRITHFNNLFQGTFNRFNGNISKWDVSNGIYFNDMFSESNFRGDISNWDVSNGTNFHSMFLFSPFDGDLSKWNLSKAETCESMFALSQYKHDVPINIGVNADINAMYDIHYLNSKPVSRQTLAVAIASYEFYSDELSDEYIKLIRPYESLINTLKPNPFEMADLIFNQQKYDFNDFNGVNYNL